MSDANFESLMQGHEEMGDEQNSVGAERNPTTAVDRTNEEDSDTERSEPARLPDGYKDMTKEIAADVFRLCTATTFSMNLKALQQQLKGGAVLYFNWGSDGSSLWYASGTSDISKMRIMWSGSGRHRRGTHMDMLWDNGDKDGLEITNFDINHYGRAGRWFVAVKDGRKS